MTDFTLPLSRKRKIKCDILRFVVISIAGFPLVFLSRVVCIMMLTYVVTAILNIAISDLFFWKQFHFTEEGLFQETYGRDFHRYKESKQICSWQTVNKISVSDSKNFLRGTYGLTINIYYYDNIIHENTRYDINTTFGEIGGQKFDPKICNHLKDIAKKNRKIWISFHINHLTE